MKLNALSTLLLLTSVAASGCASEYGGDTEYLAPDEAQVQSDNEALGAASLTATIVPLSSGFANMPTFKNMFSGLGATVRPGGQLVVKNTMQYAFGLEIQECGGGSCRGPIVARGSVGRGGSRAFTMPTAGLYRVSVVGRPGSGYQFFGVAP